MTSYQYPPLSGPRCTRLIRLHPGTTKDPSCPLSCDLIEIDLDNPPDYLALSYTWNGETPSEPLAIGNAQADTSQAAGSQLLITPNCAAALRVFRKSLHQCINRRKSLTLWVDAICINQDSNDDKSSQVMMMAEIFNQAKRVVVWLGERDSPSKSSTVFCSLSCALLPDVHIGCLSDFFLWTRSSKALRWFEPLVKRLERRIADTVLNCCDEGTIHAMLHNPYWTRVWTVQEFANTRVSLLCQSSNMISCAGMMSMIFLTDRISGVHTLHHRLYEERRAFGQSRPDVISFPGGFLSILALQASEPRDKIFGLRALSPKVFVKVAVDYERPLQDLFTETSMVVFKETNNLFFLYFASLDKTSPGTGTGLMPSWSFDFGTKYFHEDHYGAHMIQTKSFNTSREGQPWISFPNPGKSLRVRGRSVGVIGDLIGNIDPTGNSWLMEKTAMGDGCRQQVDDDGANSVSTIEEGRSNRLRKLMVYFVSILHQSRGAALPLETKMAQTIFELMQSIAAGGYLKSLTIPSLAPNATFEDLLEALCDDSEISSKVKYNMGEGRMFFTTDWRAGLGVPRLSEGDEVFLIAGLEHPFVLRPHGDGGEYTLVGPAIVTGMMKGELWPDDESELRDIDIV